MVKLSTTSQDSSKDTETSFPKSKAASKNITKERKSKMIKSNGSFYNDKKQPSFSQSFMEKLIKQHVSQSDKRYDEIKLFIKNKIAKDKLTDSFYVFDIKSIYARIKNWRHLMPRVEIFFAAKCNSNEEIGKACVEMNIGFDVASGTEIE
jgi:hypothetical protein